MDEVFGDLKLPFGSITALWLAFSTPTGNAHFNPRRQLQQSLCIPLSLDFRPESWTLTVQDLRPPPRESRGSPTAQRRVDSAMVSSHATSGVFSGVLKTLQEVERSADEGIYPSFKLNFLPFCRIMPARYHLIYLYIFQIVTFLTYRSNSLHFER